jgi:very-short-patch-repair endonuclease
MAYYRVFLLFKATFRISKEQQLRDFHALVERVITSVEQPSKVTAHADRLTHNSLLCKLRFVSNKALELYISDFICETSYR